MASIVSQSTASSNTTTEAPPVPRVHVYLTDSDSEASDEPSKRRKVSKQLYEPVWVQREPETHRLSRVKTYSVLTQWKPFPNAEEQSYAKWIAFDRKLELRNRNIDIYRAKWKEVQDYDLDEHPELHGPQYRFVDDTGSCSVDIILEGLERHYLEQLQELDSDSDSDGVPAEVDDEQHYISDLEDPEY